jgi:tetratricopeptide (TPR) repeat protein
MRSVTMVCLMLAFMGRGQAAEEVGELGGADRLVVRGLTTIPAESLRDGLLEDPELYWLGLPSADKADYLESLQARSTLALQAAGFAEPRVKVTTERSDDGDDVVVVDVVEGPRLIQGPIRVSGLSDTMAARLITYLQEKQRPIHAEPETIDLPDGTVFTRWRYDTGDVEELINPAWEPGKPVDFSSPDHCGLYACIACFFCCEGFYEVAGVGGEAVAEPLATVREHVDVSLVCEDGRATLVIDVPRLPPQSRLKAIELGDDLRTTSEDLQSFLGITLGQAVTNGDRVTWLAKLRESGRFVSHDVVFRLVPGGVVARFDLVEYVHGRPLAEPPSPEERGIRRIREWLIGQLHSGRDIRLRAVLADDGNDDAQAAEADLVIGSDAGIVAALRLRGDQYGLAMARGTIGLYGPTARVEVCEGLQFAPKSNARLFVSVDDEETESPRQRSNLTVGAWLTTRKNVPQVSIEPVWCAAAANVATSRMDGETLVLEFEAPPTDGAEGPLTSMLRIDPATGQCFGGRLENWSFDVTTGKDMAAELIASLEASSGANVADAERPVAALGAFLISLCESLPPALRGVIDTETLECYQKSGDRYAGWIRRGLEKPMASSVESAVASAAAELFSLVNRQLSDGPLSIPFGEKRASEMVDDLKADSSKFAVRYAAPRILRTLEHRHGRDAWPVAVARITVLLYVGDSDLLGREVFRLHRSGGLRAIVDGLAAILGDDHPAITELRTAVASFTTAMDSVMAAYGGAVRLPLREELERLEKIAGPQSKEALSTRLLLARTLFNQKKHAEATALLEEVIDAEVVGAVDQTVFNATHLLLIQMLVETEDHAEAVRYAEAFVARSEAGKEGGAPASEVAMARQTIAYCLAKSGDLEKSLAVYRRLLDEAEKEHGEQHPETTKLLLNVISLLNETGREREAYAVNRRPRIEIERATTTGLEPPTPARRKQPPLPDTTAKPADKKDDTPEVPPNAQDWKGFGLPGADVR